MTCLRRAGPEVRLVGQVKLATIRTADPTPRPRPLYSTRVWATDGKVSPVKVLISSVRIGLEAESESVPGLLTRSATTQGRAGL